jgi:predicted aspartyl protease
MTFRSGWMVVGLLALLCQRLPAQSVPSVTKTSTCDSIPFQLVHHFMIQVAGRIGGGEPLKLILDTGVTHTMVDARVASSLGLERRRGKVLNFDRYVPMDWAELPEIEIGPLHFHNVRVMVGDLEQYSEFVSGVDAIVGLDLLRANESVRIDYQTNLVAFKISGSGPSTNSGDVPALIVRVTIQGEPVRAVIDTGLQGMFLYSDRMRKHHPALELRGKGSHACERRLAGEQVLLQEVGFGPDKLPASAFLIRAAPRSLPADIDGYVGPSILGAQMIELDFANNVIRWQ